MQLDPEKQGLRAARTDEARLSITIHLHTCGSRE